MQSVEFWFDFASTYSYPAAMRVAELARRQDKLHAIAMSKKPIDA